MPKHNRKLEFTFVHAKRLYWAAQKTPEELFRSLKSSNQGLSQRDAEERLKYFDKTNSMEQKDSPLQLFLQTLRNPINYLIIGLAMASFFAGNIHVSILMCGVIIGSITLSFIQELRFKCVAYKLLSMYRPHAIVIRNFGIEALDSTTFKIPVTELVPGDLVQVSAGNIIPADIRILFSENLLVNQSALTGSVVPAEKSPGYDDAILKNLPDLKNICFSESSVVSGTGIGIVIHTGKESYVNSMAKQQKLKDETNFNKNCRHYVYRSLKFMLIMAPAIFILSLISKRSFAEAILFALTIIVSLTPKSLTWTISSNLTRGALTMLKKNVLIKRLSSLQNLSSIDILCADKTGTLTEDFVSREGALNALDPPLKKGVPEFFQSLKKYGVDAKMLTGDKHQDTLRVAKEIGFDSEKILLGPQIDILNDEELQEAVRKNSIFAQLSLNHKERIIQALQNRGHTVGFLGNGINDIPALYAADVGIAVHNSPSLVKEVSDIILLNENPQLLIEGLSEGRKDFANIDKYLRISSVIEFGTVLSILGASVFLPFLPMQPIQMFVQNLIFDFSQVGVPFDKIDEKQLLKASQWNFVEIQKMRLSYGSILAVFNFMTFALMWFYFNTKTAHTQALFQSAWFVASLFIQAFMIYLFRLKKDSTLSVKILSPSLLTTIVGLAIGIYLPFSPLASILGFTPLPKIFFLWIFGFMVLYFLLIIIQGMRRRRLNNLTA